MKSKSIVLILCLLIFGCVTPESEQPALHRHAAFSYNVSKFPKRSQRVPARTTLDLGGGTGWSPDLPLAALTTMPVDTIDVYGQNIYEASLERRHITTQVGGEDLDWFVKFFAGTNFFPIPREWVLASADLAVLDSLEFYLDLRKTNALGRFSYDVQTNDFIWVYAPELQLYGEPTTNKWQRVPRWFYSNFYRKDRSEDGWPVGCDRGFGSGAGRTYHDYYMPEYGFYADIDRSLGRAGSYGRFWGGGLVWNFEDHLHLPHWTATGLVEHAGAGTTLVRQVVLKSTNAYAPRELAGSTIRTTKIVEDWPAYIDLDRYTNTKLFVTITNTIQTNTFVYPGLTCMAPQSTRVDLAEFEYMPVREESLVPVGFSGYHWWDETAPAPCQTGVPHRVTVVTNYPWLRGLRTPFVYRDDANFPYYSATNGSYDVYCMPLLSLVSTGSVGELAPVTNTYPVSPGAYRWGGWIEPIKYEEALTWFLVDDFSRGAQIATNYGYTSVVHFAENEHLPYKIKDLDFGWESVWWPKTNSTYYRPPIMINGPAGHYARGGALRPSAYTVALVARDGERFYANWYYQSSLAALAGGTYPNTAVPKWEWFTVDYPTKWGGITVDGSAKDAALYPLDYMTWDTLTNWPKAVMDVIPKYANTTNLPDISFSLGVRPTYVDTQGHLRMAFFPFGYVGARVKPWYGEELYDSARRDEPQLYRYIDVEERTADIEFTYDLTTTIVVNVTSPTSMPLDIALTDVVLDDRDHYDTNTQPAWLVDPLTNNVFGAHHRDILSSTPYALRGGVVTTFQWAVDYVWDLGADGLATNHYFVADAAIRTNRSGQITFVPRLIEASELISVIPNLAAAGTKIKIAVTNYFGLYMNYYYPWDRPAQYTGLRGGARESAFLTSAFGVGFSYNRIDFSPAWIDARYHLLNKLLWTETDAGGPRPVRPPVTTPENYDMGWDYAMGLMSNEIPFWWTTNATALGTNYLDSVETNVTHLTRWTTVDWGYEEDVSLSSDVAGISQNPAVYPNTNWSFAWSTNFVRGTPGSSPVFDIPFASVMVVSAPPVWIVRPDNSYVVASGIRNNSFQSENGVDFIYMHQSWFGLTPPRPLFVLSDIGLYLGRYPMNSPWLGGSPRSIAMQATSRTREGYPSTYVDWVCDFGMTGDYTFSGKLIPAQVTPSADLVTMLGLSRPPVDWREENALLWRMAPYYYDYTYRRPIGSRGFGEGYRDVAGVGESVTCPADVGYWPSNAVVRFYKQPRGYYATVPRLSTNFAATVDLYVGFYGMRTNNAAPAKYSYHPTKFADSIAPISAIYSNTYPLNIGERDGTTFHPILGGATYSQKDFWAPFSLYAWSPLSLLFTTNSGQFGGSSYDELWATDWRGTNIVGPKRFDTDPIAQYFQRYETGTVYVASAYKPVGTNQANIELTFAPKSMDTSWFQSLDSESVNLSLQGYKGVVGGDDSSAPWPEEAAEVGTITVHDVTFEGNIELWSMPYGEWRLVRSTGVFKWEFVYHD